MNHKLILLLFITFLSGSPAISFAQQDSTKSAEPQYTKRLFLLGSIGLAKMNYHDGLEKQLDYYRGDIDHFSLDFDFGLYARLNPYFLLGPVFNIGVDTYKNGSDWFQVNQVMLGVSALWNFYPNFEGLYIRGDLGVTNFVIIESLGSNQTTESGFGSLLSVGYAYPILKTSRIAPYATIQRSYVDKKKNYRFALGVQFIF